jgi:predicted nucleotidyltransferase
MASREELLQKLRLIKPALLQKYPISRLAIFGSYGRGDFSDHSDLDILVELQGGMGIGYISLALELESALGIKVDLVSKNGLKPKYLQAIEQDLTYV